MLSHEGPHNFRRSADAPDLGSFAFSSWRSNLRQLFHPITVTAIPRTIFGTPLWGHRPPQAVQQVIGMRRPGTEFALPICSFAWVPPVAGKLGGCSQPGAESVIRGSKEGDGDCLWPPPPPPTAAIGKTARKAAQTTTHPYTRRSATVRGLRACRGRSTRSTAIGQGIRPG